MVKHLTGTAACITGTAQCISGTADGITTRGDPAARFNNGTVVPCNGFAVILRCARFLARLEGWPYAQR
jgi:hypothetical protein